MKLRVILAVGMLVYELFAPAAAEAQDETKALLEAKRVADEIRVQYGSIVIAGKATSEKKVQYAVDDGTTFRELKNTPTLTATDTIFLRYADFNPLTRAVSGSETSVPDPIEAQLARFNAAAVANLTAIFPTAKFGAGIGAEKSDCAVVRDACETMAAGLTAASQSEVRERCRENFRVCVCTAINKEVSNLQTDASAFTDEVKPDDLTSWMTMAKGRQGVKDTIAAIRRKMSTINDRLQLSFASYDRLRGLDAEIMSAACKSPPVPEPTNESADVKKARVAQEIDDAERVRISRLAEAKVANDAGKKLLESLAALVAFLEPYAVSENWRDGEGDDTDYEFFASEPTATEKKTLTITAAEKKLALENGVVTHTASPKVESNLVLRYGRRFVPEVGAAVVYNEIRYPKYKVEEFEGQNIIASDGFDERKVEGAVTLNGFWNAGSDFFFPGFQIGMSTAKDFPGFLAGVAFRLNRPQRWTIGFGGIVTWYEDLDKLRVGSPVANADAIKADLKRRRSPTELYFALQYTF